MSRAAIGAFVFVVAGLAGCASPARVIRQDPQSVVVAIPDNTNVWPFFYQDEAKVLASGYIPNPVLASSHRVKVGERVTNSTDAGPVSISTTLASDEYEYQLEFRAPGAPPAGPAASLAPGRVTESNEVPRPAFIPPVLPVTPPTSPATSMPSTALPGPGR